MYHTSFLIGICRVLADTTSVTQNFFAYLQMCVPAYDSICLAPLDSVPLSYSLYYRRFLTMAQNAKSNNKKKGIFCFGKKKSTRNIPQVPKWEKELNAERNRQRRIAYKAGENAAAAHLQELYSKIRDARLAHSKVELSFTMCDGGVTCEFGNADLKFVTTRIRITTVSWPSGYEGTPDTETLKLTVPANVANCCEEAASSFNDGYTYTINKGIGIYLNSDEYYKEYDYYKGYAHGDHYVVVSEEITQKMREDARNAEGAAFA